MAGGLPDFQFAQPVTNFQQGMQAGNALQAQHMQMLQMQRDQGDQNALRSALSSGLTGSSQDRQNALSTLAAQAPTQVQAYQTQLGSLDAQKASQLQAGNQAIFRKVQDIASLPVQSRQAAYDASVAQMKADGGDVSALMGQPWNIGLKIAVSHVQSVDDILKTNGYGGTEGTVVSPGGVLVDKNTGTKLFSNPANGQFQNINTGQIDPATGQPIQQQGLVNPQSGSVTPLSLGGGASSGYQTQITPASPSNATIVGTGDSTPMSPTAQQANAALDRGATVDQALQQVVANNPNAHFGLTIDKNGRFVDDKPSSVTGTASQGDGGVGTSIGMGGGVPGAQTGAPLAFGQSVNVPKQAAGSFDIITDANGEMQRVNKTTGEVTPLKNADGSPLTAKQKSQGGTQGAAAIVRANAGLNKMQAEGNYAAEAAVQSAAILTGADPAALRKMKPDQFESFVARNANTGLIQGHLHPYVAKALHPYINQLAMSNAVINSQGNKPTDADIKYGQEATVDMTQSPETNAKLLRQAFERPQEIANQINTFQTQLANGGSLPDGTTLGGVGIGLAPGSPNQPFANDQGATTQPAAQPQGGWSIQRVH